MWRPTLHADAHDRAARRAAQVVTVAATVLFTLVVCRWRPWDLFARGGFSTDFYDEQARSFLRGRLSVRPQVADIEGFLIDGRTYLYYGPFLAIVRLPFALFGGVFTQRLTRLSMIVGYVAFCTGSFHVLDHARRWARDHWGLPVAAVASAWRTGAFVAAAACSPMLFLTGWVSVYHETEMWAATFSIWIAVGVLRMIDTPSRRNAVVTASLIVAAILTRAPVGLGAAAGAGMVALTRWRRDRSGSLTVVAGAVAGFAIHSMVNWAKFGSPTALPADRQVLSLRDPDRAAWFAGNHGSFFSIKFVPTTVIQYLRPDTVRFERLVPFVRYGPLAHDRSSYPLETITPSSSLTVAATLLCVGAVVGMVMVVRHRDVVWGALVLGAAIAAVPTFTIGFIANRYLVDMMPLLLLPAALAVACITLPTAATRLRRPARAAVVAVIVWTAWCNVSLATWTQNLKEPGFTELRYRLDDVAFGNPAPSLRVIDSTSPVPRDGIVGLAFGGDGADCQAVYIAEQGAWVNLERLDGEHQLTGTVDPQPGTATIAGGDTWDVSLVVDDASVRVVLDDGAASTAGDPLPRADGPVAVRIVNDDILRQFEVTVDGRTTLFRFGALPGSMVPSTELHPTSASADTPGDHETLCRRLQRRL